MNCKTCKFWENLDPAALTGNPQGHCHRYPPHPTAVPGNSPSGIEIRFTFAVTLAKAWCGEYIVKLVSL